MWWLAIPATIGLGKIIYDAVGDYRAPRPTPPADTILIKNLRALKEMTAKPDAHRVAFLGQPGAGKSTIVSKLSKGRARPAPLIGTRTDATNWAERTGVDLLCHWGKRVAADVPGYDTTTHPVSAFVTYFPFANFGKICLVIRGKIHASDVKIYEAMRRDEITPIVLRTCAESLEEGERQAALKDLGEHFVGLRPSSIVFVSSRTGEGFDELRLRL